MSVTATAVEPTDSGSLTLAVLKQKKKSRKGGNASGREDGDGCANEELKALEAHMLRLSKQGEVYLFRICQSNVKISINLYEQIHINETAPITR